jgi:hypothetical protein
MHFTLMPGSLHPSTGAQNAFLASAGFITLLHSTRNRFFFFWETENFTQPQLLTGSTYLDF